MSFLQNLLNPPPTQGDIKDHYSFFNNVDSALNGLTSVRNPSVLLHPNFDLLSAKGLNPTIPADGDGTEFIAGWKVFGAANANYIITPTIYPIDSTVQSASTYFVDMTTSSFNGNAFYFYQRQSGTVRKYQKDYLTYTVLIQNNQSKQIKLRMDVYTFYDPSDNLTQGSTFFLQPGFNSLSCKIPITQSLDRITVGAGNYTEFRMNFLDFVDGTSDLDFYQIKCEFGKISTPLIQ